MAKYRLIGARSGKPKMLASLGSGKMVEMRIMKNLEHRDDFPEEAHSAAQSFAGYRFMKAGDQDRASKPEEVK